MRFISLPPYPEWLRGPLCWISWNLAGYKADWVWIWSDMSTSLQFLQPYICNPYILSHGSTVLVGLDLLIVEVSRLHSDTLHSLGLLWTSDRPVAETSTWQNTTLAKDTSLTPAGFETIIWASEGPQTHTLDCLSPGIDCNPCRPYIFSVVTQTQWQTNVCICSVQRRTYIETLCLHYCLQKQRILNKMRIQEFWNVMLSGWVCVSLNVEVFRV